jgi:predicted MFS family arabinose efflux permease
VLAVDAVSYLGVIASLMAMRIEPRPRHDATEMHVLDELVHGWRYILASVPIRTALLMVAIVSTAGTPYSVLMPAMAAQELGGGPNALGILMASAGVGALAGALYLASRESVLGLGRVIMYATLLFGGSLVGFSRTHSLLLAAVLLALVGAGFMMQLAATNTFLQTIVEERLRGRVMSFYTMAFFGTVPIGSLIGGAVAERVGAPLTIALSGLVCLMAGAWFAWRLPALRALVRPVYRELGILTVPAVDAGAKTL